MAFTQKLIDVEFNLATGSFQGGGNGVTVSGLRVSCHIENTGDANQSTLVAAIYGLPLSTMNQLSTVGKDYNRQMKNGVRVQAGDSSSKSVVFAGVISSCFVDAQAMPQVCLRVIANMSNYWQNKPATPISRSGSVKATDLMSNLAQQMGFTYEDNGIGSIVLSNPYYGGTLWTQMLQIAKHGGFNLVVDKGVMAVSPQGSGRQGDAVLISPQTGMKGYPRFSQNNVIVETLFNPALKYNGYIQVQSDLTSACGKWLIKRLEYDLESMVPKGKWFTTVEGVIA